MNKKIKLFDPDNREVPVEVKVFPGGEVKVRILDEHCAKPGEFYINALLFNSVDVMVLVMLADACHCVGLHNIKLIMPYVPYARQDRVCNSGESFSIRAFANIINSLNFSRVVVYDIHSKAALDEFKRIEPVPSYQLIREHSDAYDWICRSIWSGVPTYLVCPDKGAIDRTNAIAERFSFHGVIYADKVRRPEDGVITGIALTNIEDAATIKDAKLLVVDDIIDGGRTFIELAKVLKQYKPAQMNLYATHGIFSQGKGVLLKDSGKIGDASSGDYDNVWCTIDFTGY